jgi:hypothetical protein
VHVAKKAQGIGRRFEELVINKKRINKVQKLKYGPAASVLTNVVGSGPKI